MQCHQAMVTVVCLTAGFAANFILLSWLNALYSFDYQWSLTKDSLQKRIYFFEHHWAFFAGRPTYSCIQAGLVV